MTTCWTWRKAKLNSRHGLEMRRVLHDVSPGGNKFRSDNELFSQECNKELPIEPGLCALRVLLGQVTEIGDLLEALEDQFDLPSQAIPFQNGVGGKGSSANVVKTITYFA